MDKKGNKKQTERRNKQELEPNRNLDETETITVNNVQEL